jgi:hypothetical protein
MARPAERGKTTLPLAKRSRRVPCGWFEAKLREESALHGAGAKNTAGRVIVTRAGHVHDRRFIAKSHIPNKFVSGHVAC